jgi:hypothetical protein
MKYRRGGFGGMQEGYPLEIRGILERTTGGYAGVSEADRHNSCED